jgi:hypothetical protein
MLYRVHQQIDDQLTQTVAVPVAGKISVKKHFDIRLWKGGADFDQYAQRRGIG